jgi:hypothetical protein
MDTSTPATNIPTPPTNTPSPSAVATSSIIPSSPIPATPQGAPVSTDPLDSMKASITSQLKAQNAPQSDIDKAMGLVDDQWGNYQYEQANQGVAGTGFGKTMINNAIDSGTQTAGTFAAAPQTTAGVLMPENTSDVGVSGVGKAAANTLSDAWSMGTSLIGLLNPASWPTVVGNILKDPMSLAGPAIEQGFYGVNNAISDLISGQPNKIWGDLDEGTQKALISLGNHPVMSILGPIAAMEGLGEATDLATDAEKTIPGTEGTPYAGYTTGAQTLAKTSMYNAANLVSQSIAHPIQAISDISKGVTDSFTNAYQQFSKSGTNAAFRASLSKVVGSFNAVNEIDDVINARPDYQAIYQQLTALRDEAAKTGITTDNLSGFIKDLTSKSSPEFADLIQKRDIFSQSIKDGIPSITAYSNVIGNTLREMAEQNGFRTTAEMKDAMMNQGLSLSVDAKGFYEKNLNDKAGNPISVDSTPAINAYNDFIKRTNPSTSADENVTLRNQRDELVLRQALSEANGNLKKASDIIQKKFGGLRSSDNYTSPIEGVSVPEGMSPDSLRSINWSKIDSSYYQGLSASGLKAVSSRFQNLDIAKMGKSGAIGKAYGDIIEPAINQALKDAVNSVNPSGWKAVQSADALWAKFKTDAAKFGLEGGDPSKVSSLVYGDWDAFKQAFPQLVPKAQQMKVGDIISESTDVDHTTGQASINVQKLGDQIADNQNILGPELSNQLSSVVRANQLAQTISDAKDLQVKNLEEKMREAKETAIAAPADRVAFELKARGIQSLDDLNKLSQSSGLSPEELGKTAVYSIVNEVASKPKTNTGFTIEDASTALKEFDKLGGGSQAQDVIKQMFPDTTNADGTVIPNPIRQTIDGLQKLVDQASATAKRHFITRAVNLAIGSLLGFTGHVFMGIGFLRRGVTSGAKDKADFGGIKTATTEGFAPPAKESGIISKGKTNIKTAITSRNAKIGAVAANVKNSAQ